MKKSIQIVQACLWMSFLSGYPLLADDSSVVRSSDYQHQFLAIDHDQNGYISKLESLSELPLSDSYNNFDLNNDERISAKEFRPYFNIRYGAIANAKPTEGAEIVPGKENSFYLLDKDKNGVITIDEFSRIKLKNCETES